MSGDTNSRRKQGVDEIDTLNKKLSVARSKLLNETIDYEDYQIMKAECKEKTEKLEL